MVLPPTEMGIVFPEHLSLPTDPLIEQMRANTDALDAAVLAMLAQATGQNVEEYSQKHPDLHFGSSTQH